MEYYSAIEDNEIMPFAATWVYLKLIILSELSQRQISYDITYMWNLKNDTNELVYQTERFTDFKLMIPKDKRCVCGRGKLQVWD